MNFVVVSIVEVVVIRSCLYSCYCLVDGGIFEEYMVIECQVGYCYIRL